MPHETEPSMSKRGSARPHALRPGRIDGLKVRIIDGAALSDMEFARTLRMLARMMVRAHQADGDHQAIDAVTPFFSPLTRAAVPRTHDSNEAA